MGVNADAKLIRKRFDSRERAFASVPAKASLRGQFEAVSFSLVGGKKLERGSEKLTTPSCVFAPARMSFSSPA